MLHKYFEGGIHQCQDNNTQFQFLSSPHSCMRRGRVGTGLVVLGGEWWVGGVSPEAKQGAKRTRAEKKGAACKKFALSRFDDEDF